MIIRTKHEGDRTLSAHESKWAPGKYAITISTEFSHAFVRLTPSRCRRLAAALLKFADAKKGAK